MNLTEDLQEAQNEKSFKKEWNLCPKKFERVCQWGLCDPLIVVLWKGSDSEGNALTSFFESFLSFATHNKQGIYDDLSNVSYDEEYLKTIVQHLEIPSDILLRLDNYAKEKKRTKNMQKE